MPKPEFVNELRELGFDVQDLDGDKVSFSYEIPCGRLAGQQIKLGFLVPGDYNLTPPSGPHVCPRLLPMNPTGGTHPTCGVHESQQFGTDWQYWSRPLSHWAQTQRRAKDVMAHINHLFDTL